MRYCIRISSSVSFGMTPSQRLIFNQLLEKVAITFRENHPEISSTLADLNGEEIKTFRDELINNVGGSISEKWFYTHIKNVNDTLPRIDTLNLFAQYTGHENWKQFVYQFEQKENLAQQANNFSKKKLLKNKKTIIAFILAAILILATFFLLKKEDKHYSFSFRDKNTGNIITDSSLNIHLIKDEESPFSIQLGEGIFRGTTKETHLEFTIEGPYYKSTRVRRNVNHSPYQETITLDTDDYAMLIYMISHADIKDWKRRKKQLNEVIHNEARIYQVSEAGFGMDIYNKEEFIKNLILPIKNIKNIEILSTEYKDDKIVKLRFLKH